MLFEVNQLSSVHVLAISFLTQLSLIKYFILSDIHFDFRFIFYIIYIEIYILNFKFLPLIKLPTCTRTLPCPQRVTIFEQSRHLTYFPNIYCTKSKGKLKNCYSFIHLFKLKLQSSHWINYVHTQKS